MRVLVTGASGFLGSSVCKLLEKNSFQVIRLLRKKNPHHKFDAASGTVFGDITEKKSLRKLIQKPPFDAIIHCAGLAHQFGDTPRESFWDINVRGTRNICEISRQLKVKHFIHISSVSVYGKQVTNFNSSEPSINETQTCQPEGFYAQSKLESEKVCREIFKDQKINLTILRPTTIIGEGDLGNVARLIRLIDSGKFVWVGKGGNLKSLIYKKDCARAIKVLLENKEDREEVFNLSANPLSMGEIVDCISFHLNKKIWPVKLPKNLTIYLLKQAFWISGVEKLNLLGKSLDKWISNEKHSSQKIFEMYKFQPKYTAQTALKREIEWFLGQKNLK